MWVYGEGLRTAPAIAIHGCDDAVRFGGKLLLTVLALACLTGANPPPEQAPQGEGTQQPNPAQPLALPNAVDAPQHESRCPYGDSDQNSQLCAEWRATVATEEATDLAYSANWIATGGAVLTFVSILLLIWTLRLTREQLEVVKQDRDDARDEAAKLYAQTTATVAQARRSADSMASVARSMDVNAAQIIESVRTGKMVALQQREFGILSMRPYLSVVLGESFFQDDQYNFSSSPILQNTGNTYAKNVRYRCVGAVLPTDLPEDFKFWLPKHTRGRNMIGPGQTPNLPIIYDNRVPAEWVQRIKGGLEWSFYVWGAVTYDGPFRQTYRLTFMQRVFWHQTGPIGPDGIVPEEPRCIYLGRHNSAN